MPLNNDDRKKQSARKSNHNLVGKLYFLMNDTLRKLHFKSFYKNCKSKSHCTLSHD